jgi:hypothetical protein
LSLHHPLGNYASAPLARTHGTFFDYAIMTNPLIGLWPSPITHNTRDEGIRLGLIVGTVTWLWVAFLDAVTGNPWHTFSVLGGVLVFSIAHYLLNVVYGMVVVSVVHGAERTPSLIIGAIFVGLTFEGAFVMVSSVLIQQSLTNVAWLGLVGGNLIGTTLAIALLSRNHPLRDYVRRAEEET